MIRTEPAKKFFVCDGCGAEAEHVVWISPRPKYWSRVMFERDAYDWQGQAVANGTVLFDYCQSCTDKVERLLPRR